MLRKIIVLFIAITLGIIALVLWATDYFSRAHDIPTVTDLTDNNTLPQEDIPRLTVIASDLQVPWDLTFLPDNSILVTERPGRVQKVDPATGEKELIATIDDVLQNNESGLHGITLHPNFEQNNHVYLYYTYASSGDGTRNRVTRYTYSSNSLEDPQIIVDNIPGASIHDGGRIRFGPDEYLYIAAGDASQPSLAQNTNSLAGKILRVTDDGTPAPGNPFDNRVYSYGHRNPQGITWDEQGRLWENEHGQTATDELNFIEEGLNYGWPTIRGDQSQENMQTPVIQSGQETWAPSGNAYRNGSIFFAGLRSNTLFEAVLDGENVTVLRSHLVGELGRLRGVVRGPDNMIYLTTSNTDGRGVPSQGDDKIIRINPDKL